MPWETRVMLKTISTIFKLKIGSRCNLATPDLGVMQK